MPTYEQALAVSQALEVYEREAKALTNMLAYQESMLTAGFKVLDPTVTLRDNMVGMFPGREELSKAIAATLRGAALLAAIDEAVRKQIVTVGLTREALREAAPVINRVRESLGDFFARQPRPAFRITPKAAQGKRGRRARRQAFYDWQRTARALQRPAWFAVVPPDLGRAYADALIHGTGGYELSAPLIRGEVGAIDCGIRFIDASTPFKREVVGSTLDGKVEIVDTFYDAAPTVEVGIQNPPESAALCVRCGLPLLPDQEQSTPGLGAAHYPRCPT